MSSKPEKRQVVRFAFYKLDSAWRRLSAERQAASKIEFGETIESFNGRLLLRPYGLVGIRGDCDFLLWQVAEDLDSLVALQTALNRSDLGAYLALPYSYLAMTRRSIYEFPEAPGQPSRLHIRPSDARYLFVYPFTQTRAWYHLPQPERGGARDRQPLHPRARQPVRGDARPGALHRDVSLARRGLLARVGPGARRPAPAAGRGVSRQARGGHRPHRSGRGARAHGCPPPLTTVAS